MTTKINSNRFINFNGQTLTFPSALGSVDQVIATNGSGTLSYTANLNGMLGGSVLLVDPAAPNAADDNNPKTPYVTIQAAIDDCPTTGVVYVAPNGGAPYSENITLDRDVFITGFNPSSILLGSYTYIEGGVTVPTGAAGSFYQFAGLYHENTTLDQPNFYLNKSCDIAFSNCQIYNYNLGSSSHVIELDTGANGSNLYFSDVGGDAEAGNNLIKYTAGAAVSLTAFKLETASPLDISYIVEIRASRLGRLNFLSNAVGRQDIVDCKFSSYINSNTAVSCTLINCNFSGEDYSNYYVSSTPAVVYVDNISFINTDLNEGGKPKGVSGVTEFRLDALMKEVRLATVTGINGASVADITLYTTPNVSNYKYHITKVILRIATASGLTGTLVVGVGNNANEDDIFPAQTLLGFDAVDDTYTFNAMGVSKAFGQNQAIKLGIDTAFGGTVTLDAQVFGYIVRV